MRARTQEAKDERRTELLSVALDVFYERGFDLARMDDIARRAGVSKGAVYLYFDSKEALFNALIQEIAAPIPMAIRENVRAAGDPEEALRAFLRSWPMIIRETPVPKIIKVLIGASATFPELVTAYREDVIERAVAVIASVLEAGRAADVFDIDDPMLTAELVIGPFIGAVMRHVVLAVDHEAEVDFEELFTLHEKLVLRALKPAAGRTR